MSQRLLICILGTICLAPAAAQDQAHASAVDGTFCGLTFGISREETEQTLENQGLPVLGSGLTDIVHDASALLDCDRSGILLRSACGFECEASASPVDGLLSGIAVECRAGPKGGESLVFFESLLEELTMELGPPYDSREQPRDVTHDWNTETAEIRLFVDKWKEEWRVLLVANWPEARWPLLEWRYEPAVMNGEPADVNFTIFVDFRLS